MATVLGRRPARLHHQRGRGSCGTSIPPFTKCMRSLLGGVCPWVVLPLSSRPTSTPQRPSESKALPE
eukprot:scaffold264604_cov31-Tisochrysis_lutea.AAC.4